MSGVIHTDRLTKRYGDTRGIENVSMSVETGEVFGFLGPNGAGKTTTIRTLLDLMHPTSGSARLFGLDSRRESLAIRARVGNLPGDFSYDPRLTGRELVSFLAEIRGLRGAGPRTAARRPLPGRPRAATGRAFARRPPEDRPDTGFLPQP